MDKFVPVYFKKWTMSQVPEKYASLGKGIAYELAFDDAEQLKKLNSSLKGKFDYWIALGYSNAIVRIENKREDVIFSKSSLAELVTRLGFRVLLAKSYVKISEDMRMYFFYPDKNINTNPKVQIVKEFKTMEERDNSAVPDIIKSDTHETKVDSMLYLFME